MKKALIYYRGGQGYSEEYQAVLDAWGTAGIALPDNSRKTKDDLLIRQLKDAGIWALKDIFYVLASHHTDAATFNWKNPSQFRITKVNSPSFVANQGFTGNGTSSYLNTNWKPNNGVNYTLNNAGIGGHINTNVQRNDNDWGSNSASFANAVFFTSRNGSDQTTLRLNDASTFTKTGITDSIGLWHTKRTSATDRVIYKNGIEIQATGVGTSQALNALNIYIGALNNNGTAQSFTTRQYSCFWAGASLSGLESSLYTAWNTYLTSL